MSRQIILDTETTGLSVANDRVIELGCVELINRKITGNDLHIYFNPEQKSTKDALKVHGMTNKFLRDKPKFAVIANDLVEYLRGAELIDVSFLNKEFDLAGLPRLQTFVREITDTLIMAKSMYPNERNSLAVLCDRFNVDNTNNTFHGRKRDALLLAQVYLNLTRSETD